MLKYLFGGVVVIIGGYVLAILFNNGDIDDWFERNLLPNNTRCPICGLFPFKEHIFTGNNGPVDW